MRNLITNEIEDKKIPKILVRRLQSIFNGWSRQPQYKLLSGTVKVFDFCGCETFYGYYDRSPLNSSRTKVLFYRSNVSTKLNPRLNGKIELVLWNYIKNEQIKCWDIYAYNWQQGSKVQWINDTSFIFNNYDLCSKSYFSVIVNTITFDEERIEMPAYESCDRFFLSLNFNRLYQYRPDYGYRNIPKKFLDDKTDGIFIYDFKVKQNKLLVSIEDLKNLNFTKSMVNANHKVNHIMLSPSQKSFMFMHRWIKDGLKTDRLYVYNLGTSELSCVADYGMISHCCWYNDDIIGYMNGPSGKEGYYKISKNGFLKLSSSVQNLGDGHPSILGDKMVIDTYPDKKRMKHLYLFDLLDCDLIEIGQFKESMGYECQCRCDLHPRYIGENIISIDSTHIGKRVFCIIEI